MPVLYVAVALLGLAIGSFLNVVIYRVPAGQSLSSPASHCPRCEHPIRNRHNIPVLGWLVLRGRCADCRAPISVRYPLVELGTGTLFVAVTWRIADLHQLPALPAYLAFAAIAITLAMIDIDVHKLPSSIVLPAYPVLALALTIAAVVSDQPAALVRAAICGAAAFVVYYVMNFVYPKGMGYGDVRLSGIPAGMLGYLSSSTAVIGFFGAFLLAGCYGFLALATRRNSRKSHLPFGPFMLAMALIAIFFGQRWADLYSSYAGLSA